MQEITKVLENLDTRFLSRRVIWRIFNCIGVKFYYIIE